LTACAEGSSSLIGVMNSIVTGSAEDGSEAAVVSSD